MTYDLTQFVRRVDKVAELARNHDIQVIAGAADLYEATVKKYLSIPEEVLDMGRREVLDKYVLLQLGDYQYPNAEEIALICHDLEVNGDSLSVVATKVGLNVHHPYFQLVGLDFFLAEIDYDYKEHRDWKPPQPRKYAYDTVCEILDELDNRKNNRQQTRARLAQKLGLKPRGFEGWEETSRIFRRAFERYTTHKVLPYLEIHHAVRK